MYGQMSKDVNGCIAPRTILWRASLPALGPTWRPLKDRWCSRGGEKRVTVRLVTVQAEVLNARARVVLWLDGAPALVVGLALLALRDPLAELYRLDTSLVRFVGFANLGYGCYSGSLAARATRGRAPSRRSIEWLALLNFGWLLVCSGLLYRHASTASALGIAQLTLEGAYVAGLAIAEWRLVRPFASPR